MSSCQECSYIVLAASFMRWQLPVLSVFQFQFLIFASPSELGSGFDVHIHKNGEADAGCVVKAVC